MKLCFANERVLAVMAHPDDTELFCAGTLARAKADGAAIAVAVLCLGDKGQPARRIARLAAVRRREMQASTRLLGAELFEGRFPDGTLSDNRRERMALTEIYRCFRPTLVLAHAPEDYHPDHRAAAALAETASWFCASRGQKTRSAAMGWPPAVWWTDTLNTNGFQPGFYVDVSEHVVLKERMILCHKSQLARHRDAEYSPLTAVMLAQCAARGAQAGVKAAEAFRPHDVFKRARAW